MSLSISFFVKMLYSMSVGIAFHLLFSLIVAGKSSRLSALVIIALILFLSVITVFMSKPLLFFPRLIGWMFNINSELSFIIFFPFFFIVVGVCCIFLCC